VSSKLRIVESESMLFVSGMLCTRARVVCVCVRVRVCVCVSVCVCGCGCQTVESMLFGLLGVCACMSACVCVCACMHAVCVFVCLGV